MKELFYRTLLKKQYEIKDHLGNVRVVVSDRKDFNTTDNSLTAHVENYSNYYPFGMMMPKRNFLGKGYRYGFGGMEKDDEVKGEGNSYTTHFRKYDSRLGRW